jgi:hypothetical protein
MLHPDLLKINANMQGELNGFFKQVNTVFFLFQRGTVGRYTYCMQCFISWIPVSGSNNNNRGGGGIFDIPPFFEVTNFTKLKLFKFYTGTEKNSSQFTKNTVCKS